MDKGYDIPVTAILLSKFVDISGHPYIRTVRMTMEPGSLLGRGRTAYYPDDKKNPTPRNEHRWETSVAVYDWDDCSNPNTTIEIVGYSKNRLPMSRMPQKRIEGLILCDRFSDEATRGGGGEFGVKGTIPGLVE